MALEKGLKNGLRNVESFFFYFHYVKNSKFSSKYISHKVNDLLIVIYYLKNLLPIWVKSSYSKK